MINRLPLTSNIRQAYETKTHFEEHSEVEFTRNFTRVIRGNNLALYRLLEVAQWLGGEERCAGQFDESDWLFLRWLSHPEAWGRREADSDGRSSPRKSACGFG